MIFEFFLAFTRNSQVCYRSVEFRFRVRSSSHFKHEASDGIIGRHQYTIPGVRCLKRQSRR